LSLPAPPALALAEILSPITRVYRRVDIYEEDGDTPFLLDAEILSGSISVDQTRDERRMCDFVLANTSNTIKHSEDSLWYDKILKCYRGCYYEDQNGDLQMWSVQVGEFFITDITSQHFPYSISIKGIDYTTQLTENKFATSTTFTAGTSVDEIVRDIALNGGVTKLNLGRTGAILSTDKTFDKSSTRWAAILDLCTANGFEIFFDPYGYLVSRPFFDPTTSPVVFSFKTDDTGVLVGWQKSTNQTQVYNQVIVYGDQDTSTTNLPVFAVATNNDPNSPTSIPRLRRTRSYEYTSALVETTDQAQNLANTMLPIVSLEDYSLNFESLVLPWLEAGEIIDFEPGDWNLGDPTRFLLSSFSIPFDLGTMSPTAKRLIMV
jgi:hypothetical protein